MADSTIKIRTQIEIKQAQVQLATLENSMRKTAREADKLRNEMKNMEGTKVNTKEYDEIAKQIQKAQAEFDKLYIQQSRMAKQGLAGTDAFNKIDDKMEDLGETIRNAEGELEDLVKTGKAFVLGEDTDKYAKLKEKLSDAEAQMDIQAQKHDILVEKENKLGNKYEEVGNKGKKAMRDVADSASKSGSAIGKFANKIKTMLAAVFIFNVIRKAINGLANGIKEGFSNMAQNFDPLKAQIDSLNASLATLKNSLAAAFAPIVTAVVPYIQKLVEWLTKLINLIGQFVAAAMGQKTYTKAVKQSASAMNGAAKAAKGYLSPIDEINKFDSKDSGGGGGAANMFEEVPIDSKVLAWLENIKKKLEPIKEYMEELKKLFTNGLFDGLGDWSTRWNGIKADLSSIKSSLIGIFTDPEVLASADRLVKSLAYTLGTLVGSIASIGLSIAANLIGGIESYLSSNSERIKNHLITMFDVWTEISNMLSGFFISLGTIFEAFASESGQLLTGNLIGIFSSALMGTMEVASKLARDLMNIIIQPFVDNQDAFRQALEGLFSILAEVAGTIKTGIDETFATLNQVYDEHFAPFFKSVSEGISSIIGSLLGFWNEHLQPLLDKWATGFDELWKKHLQPFLDSVIEFFGSIADLVKALWDNALVPFINYIINEVLPLILPILDQIWQTLSTLFADIADLFTDFVKIFKGIIDLITAIINGDWQAAWDSCKSIISGIFDAILDVIKGVINLIINTIGTAIQGVITAIAVAGSTIIGTVVGIVTGIMERISKLFIWLAEKVTGGMTSVKAAWDSAWNGFLTKVKTVWDSIASTISGVISKITGWINTISEKWNGLKNGISSGISGILGGTVGRIASNVFSVEAPAFATGGVIPTGVGQHLAVVGDNKHETEVVSPLSTIKEALIEAMGTTNSNTTVKLYLDGQQIAESVVKAGRINQMSTGENMFALS